MPAPDPFDAPPQQAVDRGHQPAWDPPHALSSARRWTCQACGAAVVDAHGNVYGSATERDCAAVPPPRYPPR